MADGVLVGLVQWLVHRQGRIEEGACSLRCSLEPPQVPQGGRFPCEVADLLLDGEGLLELLPRRSHGPTKNSAEQEAACNRRYTWDGTHEHPELEPA